MLVARSMHEGWLSNAWVVGDEPGGTCVFVDSGAPLEPLLQYVEEQRLTPAFLLTTHSHADHVANDDILLSRFELRRSTGPVEAGSLRVEALRTPGHAPDHVSFVVNGEACCAGDILCRDSVGGGTDVDAIRHSVMDVLMELPPETRVLPGHSGETTIGREWEENPFVLYWRGEAPPLDEPVTVGGAQGELLVWGPDYDGKGKALVRLDDGREAIVGGSRVTRS